VITDDQVVALFARANPVLSLDLLDPVGPLDPEHLGDRSERSWDMTELMTDEAQQVGRRPRWLVPVLATVVVLVAAIPLLLNNQNLVGGDRTPSEKVAYAFIDALIEHDGMAAEALFADNGLFDGMDPSSLPMELAHKEAVGWVYTNHECGEVSGGAPGTTVRCDLLLQNELAEARGLEPVPGTYVITVDEGRIHSASLRYDFAMLVDVRDRFRFWIEANHPDDIEAMYNGEGGARLDPESIALWEQHVDEYVAELGG
jgi:hypothetical protein